MARDLNDLKLMGRLTRDPEVRYNEEGKANARFGLAVRRTDEVTDFFNCVAFGSTAELVEKYLKKGIKIVVSGELTTGKYTNKEGVTIHTTDVKVISFYFCESKKSSNAAVAGGSAPDDAFMDLPDGLDEDLPFN